jgi:hypothetical protein
MENMIWIGSYRIGDLLENCLEYKKQEWPKDNKGFMSLRKISDRIPTKAYLYT